MHRLIAATAALTATLVLVAAPASANGQSERVGAGPSSADGPRVVALRYCSRC
jgi:hypothetical protein